MGFGPRTSVIRKQLSYLLSHDHCLKAFYAFNFSFSDKDSSRPLMSLINKIKLIQRLDLKLGIDFDIGVGVSVRSCFPESRSDLEPIRFYLVQMGPHGHGLE